MHIEEIEGLTKIEKLQGNENEEVYSRVVNIMEKFFSDEVKEEKMLNPEKQYEQNTFKNAESKLISNKNLVGSDPIRNKFFF